MSASRSLIRQVQKLARKLGAMGGFAWLCSDCDYRSRRLHREQWTRNMAIRHVNDTGHTVQVLEFK